MRTLKRWLTPPVFEDEAKTHQAFMLHVIVWALICVPPPYLLYTVIQTPASAGRAFAQAAFGEAANVFLLYLLRRGQVRLASIIQVIALWAFFTATAVTGAGVRGPAYLLGCGLVIVIAGVLLGGRGAMAVTGLTVVAGGVMVYAEMQGRFVPEISDTALTIWIVSLVLFPVSATLQNLAARTVRLALARARASEARTRALLEAVPDMIFELDREGTFLYFSPSPSVQPYAPPEQFIGRKLSQVMPPRVATLALEAIARVLDTGEVQQIEYQLPEGKYVREYEARLVASGSDRVMSIVRDITERKRTEAALRDSEEKLRTLIEQASDGVALVDDQGLIQEWNQAQERIAGLTHAEVIGRPFWDVQLRMMLPERRSAERREALKTTLLDWLRTGQLPSSQQPIEAVIVTPQGEPRFIQQTVFLIKTSSGNRIGSMARDITERKQAEREIQSLARFPAENPQPVLRLDQAGIILYANETSRLLLQDWAAEVGGQASPFWQAQVADALDSQSKRTVEVTCGKLVYSFVVAPVPHAGYVNLYGQDITERKSVEAEREKLIAELEVRNTELEQFTYTVSHDLKAPLVTIRGFLGFVEKDALAGNLERVRADVARITAATDKMQRLLRELLELSRIGRMMNPPQAAPFEAIAREAVELVRGRVTARGVHVEIGPDLPIVYGDRTRLIEVVQNLVDNAAKFMGDQAAPRIEIGTRGADADGKPIFFVRDNGIGIESPYHDKVFGLFTKLDAQTEGTGVGLALVKRIVEVHGGRIWVESEGIGHGAMFCFTLPVRE